VPDVSAIHPAAGRRAPKLIALAIVAAIFVVFPLVVTDPSTTSIAVFALVFMVAASAWNMFSGYSGYLALGHAVFFGCGGYAVALAARDWHVAGGWAVFGLLPFGGLVAGLIAIPVGLIALRTRRHTFVVVTIAIFFIFQLAAFNLGFTEGTSGITLPFAPFSAANYNTPFYYVGLVILVGTLLVSWVVRRSRFGLQLLAIRDDEDRALSLGVPTWAFKMTAFVVSAALVGMIGGVYGYYVTYVYPQFVVDPLVGLSMVLMAFLGGTGTIAGPVLGALLLEPTQLELAYFAGSARLYLVLYAAVFLAVILFLPRGVIPSIAERLEARRSAA